MNGFFLFVGEQGSGKTLMEIRTAFVERKKRKIFSNCWIDTEYTPIAFDTTKPSNIGKMDIVKALNKDTNVFNDSVMILDECHLYLDSRDFMKKNQRVLQTFFSQLRKRHILLLGTAQSMFNVDIRCRRQCMNMMIMNHIKSGVYSVETCKLIQDASDYRTISIYPIDLTDYYSKYHTDEIQE